jgi:hypothetical protein
MREHEMGWECGTCGTEKIRIQFWGGRDEEESEGKNQLEDPSVDGRIILDRTLQR